MAVATSEIPGNFEDLRTKVVVVKEEGYMTVCFDQGLGNFRSLWWPIPVIVDTEQPFFATISPFRCVHVLK